MSNILIIFKNPLVLVSPIVLVLLFGWQYYTHADSMISSGTSNILPNGKFDDLDNKNFPVGWQLTKGSNDVTAAVRAGYNSFHLLELSSSADVNSNTTLTSPRVNIEANETYFYKGFYKSDMPFDLLIRTIHKDGSSTLNIVNKYTASSDWTTDSAAFTSDASAASIEFIYSFSRKGDLQLDGNYLEPNPKDIYLPLASNRTMNEIPNPSLTSNDGVLPNGWSTIANGDNSTNFAYLASNGDHYLHTLVDNYKNGEEKWRYDPVSTHGGRLYDFNVTYRSTTPVDVVAEYELASGQRQYDTLESLEPAKEWTTTQPITAETPPDATSIFVTLVQHGNGYVDSKNYELYDRTKPGQITWDSPHISLTFDDGWASAYKNGVSLLDRYGYKTTYYITPSSLDTARFMTSDDVTALRKDGQELASHGDNELDFTTLPPSNIDYQLKHADDYFTQVLDEKAVNFASPFGSSDAQLVYYARKYYRSHRGTEDGINTKQNFNPYNLKALYVGNDTPISKVTDALKEAKSMNGWIILIYHQINSGGPAGDDTNITESQFQQQLAAVKESSIPVETVSKVLDDITKEKEGI